MNVFEEMLEDGFLKTATPVEKIFLYELRNITKQLKILNELKILEVYSKIPLTNENVKELLNKIDKIQKEFKKETKNG